MGALAISGTNLYVGGVFSMAGGAPAMNVAKWDGNSWSALGSGINGFVSALAASGTHVYAGGDFTTAGGNPATNMAKWDGSSWSALGSAVSSQIEGVGVSALALRGADLYAAGSFTNIGASGVNYLAKWNGTNWSALGSGVDGIVSALTISGSDLYAGGRFTNAGSIVANGIAKWNGSSWSALSSGTSYSDDGYYGSFPGGVSALTVSGTNIYAGGYFDTAGNVETLGIARWNGSSWFALGSGAISPRGSAGYVNALAVSRGELNVGGFFKVGFAVEGRVTTGGVAMNMAKWNGLSWSALGSTMNSNVSALAVSGTDLYAGGSFTSAGEINASKIAKRNANSWSALGSGFNDTVQTLAVSGTNLYAGGLFTTAMNSDGGSVVVNRVAKWNGSEWSALGAGVSGVFSPIQVSALALMGSDLYAGGHFTNAGGISANSIAKWNGTNWSPLGSGVTVGSVGSVNGSVYSLVALGTNLYVGGDFSTAGGVSASSIARWNGSSWSALGAGVSGASSLFSIVSALAVDGTNVYAGGDFTRAGGVAANNIAKWNGSSWSALGSGILSFYSGRVIKALIVSGTNLYAGGVFRTAGGVQANSIARWNGASWSPLGSGLFTRFDDNSIALADVQALAISGGDLYAGGQFDTAGNKISPFLARAALNGLPALAPTLSTPFISGGQLVFQLNGTTGSTYAIQSSTNLSVSNWLSLRTNAAPFWITNPITQPQRFFRGVANP